MSTEHDFDGLVRSWLRADDPGSMQRSAAAIADDVVALTGGLPQRRAVRSGGLRSRGRSARLAVAAAAVVVIVVAVGSLTPSGEGPGASGTGATTLPSPSRSPRFTPRATVDPQVVTPRTRPTSVDGIRFSFDPAGWEISGDGGGIDYISKSDRGPQGAEAQIVFTAFPSLGVRHWECHYLSAYLASPEADLALGPVAELVASVPGTELVAGPTSVTVGGIDSSYVEFRVRDDVGCDPGFFFLYPSSMGGALWPETAPGDTVRVWIVDVPGASHLFVEAKTKPGAGSGLLADIATIVDSIEFE